MLIEFDEMVADMKANKKISLVVAELFSRMRKLTFHLCLYHNLLSKCLLYHEIPNKRELQQIVSNHSSDIHFKDFLSFTKIILIFSE